MPPPLVGVPVGYFPSTLHRWARNLGLTDHEKKKILSKSNRNIEVAHLSGSFIRSLVSQMSSCNSKPTMNPNSTEEEHGDSSHEVEMQQQPKQVKKQVRRRFHTSRPYQERLLNMAEARREIVAALKLHRATMRSASDPQLPYPRPEVPSTSVIQGSHLAKRYRIDANMTATSLDHFNKTYFPPPLSWHYNAISPGGTCGMFNSALPKPPLGLNLNFNDFEELETALSNGGNNDSLMLSFSPPSSYSCSCVNASVAEIPVAPTELMGVCEATSEPRIESSFHPVMDDKEMELIRSIGKQHDIEWNDKLNLVHSAWWCELLWNLEENPEGHEKPTCNMEGVRFESIDEAIGASPCLSDQHVDEGCLHDATLPCYDAGEINGTDGEWFF